MSNKGAEGMKEKEKERERKRNNKKRDNSDFNIDNFFSKVNVKKKIIS